MVGVLVVTAVAVSACGSPPPAEPPPPPPTTSAAPAPRVDLPPRPRDIPVDDVDPCSLLTPADREEFGLDGDPIVNSDVTPLLGPSVSCDVLGFEPVDISAAVTVATEVGIERFTHDELAAEVEASDVAGFPAVVTHARGADDFCDVVIDVADGQLIDVRLSDSALDPDIPLEQLCADTHRLADRVLATLLTAA